MKDIISIQNKYRIHYDYPFYYIQKKAHWCGIFTYWETIDSWPTLGEAEALYIKLLNKELGVS